jgi:hypothetical protein
MRLEKIVKTFNLSGIQTHPIPLNPHGLRANRTSLNKSEIPVVSYPVDDGEFPGRVAIHTAHRVRHVLVVVVLLAVGLVRGATVLLPTRQDHVQAFVCPLVSGCRPCCGLPRGPVARRDDAEL